MLSRLLSAILIWFACLCAAVPALSQTESPVGNVVPPQIQSTSPDLSDFEVRSSDTGFLVRRKGTSNWERSSTISEPIAVGLLDGTQKVYISTKSVKSPQVLHTQEPEFPKRQLKSHARVSLYFVVDDRGKVRFPTVDESPGPDFSNAAIKAVEKWSFQPATINGVPVPVLINVTSVFTRY
jgi:TonB family protein